MRSPSRILTRTLCRTVAAAALFSPAVAFAGEAILYAPAPAWVAPQSIPAVQPPEGQRKGFVLFDQQVRIDGDRVETFIDSVRRVQSAEELANVGNLMLTWHPDKGDLTVHAVTILREGKTIDATAGNTLLKAIRREQRLESHAIDGMMTATGQISGLQVGDVVRVSYTTSFRDTALGGHVETRLPLPSASYVEIPTPATVSWANGRTLQWRVDQPSALVAVPPTVASGSAPAKPVSATVDQAGGWTRLSAAWTTAPARVEIARAPSRYLVQPSAVVSSFVDWADVSRTMAPLYKTKGTIAPGSALDARVKAIAAAHQGPEARAAAALRAVQDDIRYLFNGQVAGNYVPQSPAMTWDVRYGDCKAKTLLLLAMLDRLDVPAEAVLVRAANMSDTVEGSLPSVGIFDHVLVRATINGRTAWLDGTGSGSRVTDIYDAPPFYHALPLRAAGATLEPIAFAGAARADATYVRDVDASAGLALPKLARLTLTFRAPVPGAVKQAKARNTPEKFAEMVESMFAREEEDLVLTRHEVTFDDAAGTVTMIGEGILDLDIAEEGGRRVWKPNTLMSGFKLDTERSRTAWRDVPISLRGVDDMDRTFSLRLPDGGKGFTVENGAARSVVIPGMRWQTDARIANGTFILTQQQRKTALEMTAAQQSEGRGIVARQAGTPITLRGPEGYPTGWQELTDTRATSPKLKPLIAAYDALVKAYPDRITSYYHRGHFYQSMNEHARALADFDRMVALDPSVASLLTRAYLYIDMASPKALADLEAARALEPDSTAVISGYFAYHRSVSGDVKALADMMADSESLFKERGDWVSMYSEALALDGRADEAVTLISTELAKRKNNAQMLNARCWASGLGSVGLDAALSDCTRAIELAEGSTASMLDSRALVLMRLNRNADALADLDKALEMDPDQTSSRFLRGIVKGRMGDKAGARADVAAAQRDYGPVARAYALVGIKPNE